MDGRVDQVGRDLNAHMHHMVAMSATLRIGISRRGLQAALQPPPDGCAGGTPAPQSPGRESMACLRFRRLRGATHSSAPHSSAARLPEGCPELCEAVAGDGEHSIHGRFELELPASAVGLQPKKPDAGDVDGVLAVDPDESEGLEQRRNLANRHDID